MGYRSDVCLVLDKYGVKELEEQIAELPVGDKVKDAVLALLGEYPDEVYVSDNGDKLWLWTSIKWYMTFDSVSFIEHFISTLDGDHFYFAYIGEELTDIETQGYYYENSFNMQVRRDIYFELPKESK